jgi:hypothetical protein
MNYLARELTLPSGHVFGAWRLSRFSFSGFLVFQKITILFDYFQFQILGV